MLILKATPLQSQGKDRLFVLELERGGDTLCPVERVSFRRQHFLLVSSPEHNRQGVLQVMAVLIEP